MRTVAALTDSDLEILIVFSKITEQEKYISLDPGVRVQ